MSMDIESDKVRLCYQPVFPTLIIILNILSATYGMNGVKLCTGWLQLFLPILLPTEVFMITDIRLDVGFPGHKKTLRLIRKLADPAAPWLLVKLWIYVAQHLPDGILRGMDDDDIEAVAGWSGDSGAFAEALRWSGYIDVDADGSMSCHDWLTHNPWVALSDDRSDASRFSKLAQSAPEIFAELKKIGVKTVGRDDYAVIRQAAIAGKSLADIIDSLALASERRANASEPLAPIPSPIPIPKPSLKPKTSAAAASSQASTTPTPSPLVEQQQKTVSFFADTENRIRTAFRERHDFLLFHFPHLQLSVEEEQCVAKYRNKAIATDAAVVVLQWCKRCPKPDARSRDRPDEVAVVLADNDRVCAVFCGVDAEKRLFCEVLTRLAKRLKSRGGLPQALSDDLLMDWFESLHPLGFERIAWGARHMIENQVFFPALAEFRAAVLKAPRAVVPVVRPSEVELQRTENGAQALADILASLDAADGPTVTGVAV